MHTYTDNIYVYVCVHTHSIRTNLVQSSSVLVLCLALLISDFFQLQQSGEGTELLKVAGRSDIVVT